MMYTARRTVIVLIAVALLGAAPSATSLAQAQEPAPVQGTLAKVDTEAKTIDVMTADGKAVMFQYTDDTKVTGAQESIAGLATAKDVQVTVRFMEEGDTRIATEIEVQAAPAR